MDWTEELFRSAFTANPLHSLEDIIEWIEERKRLSDVNIEPCRFDACRGWFLDESGIIRNEKSTFFQIAGISQQQEGHLAQQPILIQNEIGYLGLLCTKIKGVLHFLMQAKIEPGNLNYIQISPTIQATKSNFTQQHGGRKPAFLEFFSQACRHRIVYDQIQSEQGSRFFKKRNRNMIVYTEEHVQHSDHFMWMTWGQLLELLALDNVVNMDTRTVLSGLPLHVRDPIAGRRLLQTFPQMDAALVKSMSSDEQSVLVKSYYILNQFRMYSDRKTQFMPLFELQDWYRDEWSMRHKEQYAFSVGFYDIYIDGREVAHWHQPLFVAHEKALFLLAMAQENDKMFFLIRLKPEIGSFDGAEFGPSLQLEQPHIAEETSVDPLDLFLLQQWKRGEGIVHSALLSEEGGRFFREENINVLLNVRKESVDEVMKDRKDVIWADLFTLRSLMSHNNVLNIQLRNLLALLRYRKDSE